MRFSSSQRLKLNGNDYNGINLLIISKWCDVDDLIVGISKFKR